MNSTTDNSKPDHNDSSWWERNVNLVIICLVIACVLSVLAQALCGSVLPPLFDEHHPAHFEIEHMLGFQAIFGFATFAVIVGLGTLLRFLIKREEDYYDA